MFAVVTVLLILRVNALTDHGWDGLLAVVEVHEAADFAGHVLLVTRVLEEAGELERGVDCGVGGWVGGVLCNLGRGEVEGFGELSVEGGTVEGERGAHGRE